MYSLTVIFFYNFSLWRQQKSFHQGSDRPESCPGTVVEGKYALVLGYINYIIPATGNITTLSPQVKGHEGALLA